MGDYTETLHTRSKRSLRAKLVFDVFAALLSRNAVLGSLMSSKINLAQQLDSAFIWTFAVIFLGVSFLLANSVLSQFVAWHEARSWVECPCTLNHVELHQDHDETTTYLTRARYEYEFKGRVYHGDRVGFGDAADNFGDFQKRTYRELRRYQQNGQPFRAFVDPHDPSQSVLYRELRIEFFALNVFVSLIFGGIGVGVVVHSRRKLRRRRDMAEMQAVYPDEPWNWDELHRDGVFRPTREWAVLLIVSIVWKGFFGLMMLGGFTKFGAVMLSVGLLMDWKCFCNWRHARRQIEVVIRPWPYFVGDELTGTVRFTKGPSKVSRIKARLLIGKSLGGDDEAIDFEAEMLTSVSGSEAQFHFSPTSNLRRSPRATDSTSDSTAEWQIKLSPPQDRTLNLTYEIRAFERPNES